MKFVSKIASDPALNMTYDDCVASMIKHSIFEEDIKKEFDNLLFRTKLDKLKLSSAWPIATLGMIELLIKLGESKSIEEMKQLLFDELWLKDIYKAFKKTKKKINEYADEIAEKNKSNKVSTSVDVSKEYNERIDQMYSGIINFKPHFIDENDGISEKLIENKKIRRKLTKIFDRMKEFTVERI